MLWVVFLLFVWSENSDGRRNVGLWLFLMLVVLVLFVRVFFVCLGVGGLLSERFWIRRK